MLWKDYSSWDNHLDSTSIDRTKLRNYNRFDVKYYSQNDISRERTDRFFLEKQVFAEPQNDLQKSYSTVTIWRLSIVLLNNLCIKDKILHKEKLILVKMTISVDRWIYVYSLPSILHKHHQASNTIISKLVSLLFIDIKLSSIPFPFNVSSVTLNYFPFSIYAYPSGDIAVIVLLINKSKGYTRTLNEELFRLTYSLLILSVKQQNERCLCSMRELVIIGKPFFRIIRFYFKVPK